MSGRTEIIGDATLYLGDCREVLPAITADVLVSDPPYGVSYRSGWDNRFRDVTIANDETVNVRNEVLAAWAPRPAIVFGSWKAPKPIGTKMVLIWDKGTVGMGDVSMPWFPCTEEIYVLGSGWHGSRTSAVLRHVGRNEHHPTEKPLSLMGELLMKTAPGSVIFDPFMGSGSTAVAAVGLGRGFIGCELHEPYFDIACRRIEAAYRQPRLFEEPAPKPVQPSLLGDADLFEGAQS